MHVRWQWLVFGLSCALAAAGCGDSDSDSRDLTAADYACEEASDCAIRSVPTCCFEQSEQVPECLNEDADLPSSADCSGNDQCAGRIAVKSCACVENEIFPPYDDPARICQGVP